MTVPKMSKIYQNPHQCTMTMKKIQTLYYRRWLSPKLYDQWRPRMEVDINWVIARSVWLCGKADEAKTTIDVASFIIHIKNNNLTQLSDAILPFCSTELYNCTVVSLLMHAILYTRAPKMIQLMNKNNLCCLSPKSYIDTFKNIRVDRVGRSRSINYSSLTIGRHRWSTKKYWEY